MIGDGVGSPLAGVALSDGRADGLSEGDGELDVEVDGLSLDDVVGSAERSVPSSPSSLSPTARATATTTTRTSAPARIGIRQERPSGRRVGSVPVASSVMGQVCPVPPTRTGPPTNLVTAGTVWEAKGRCTEVCESWDAWGSCAFSINPCTLLVRHTVDPRRNIMTALPRRVRSRLRGWSVATLVLGTLLGGTALAVTSGSEKRADDVRRDGRQPGPRGRQGVRHRRRSGSAPSTSSATTTPRRAAPRRATPTARCG